MPERCTPRKDPDLKKIHLTVLIPLILMTLLSLLCLFPAGIGGQKLQPASIALIIGIAAFFLTRKTNDGKNPDRPTVWSWLKDRNCLTLMFMPLCMNVISLLTATFFVPEFIAHLKARTGFLSFHMIPVLVIELVIAALGEEIAWRAFFQKQLCKIVPFWPAVMVSSALFAICHFNQGSAAVVVYDLVFIWINAIIYGVIFRKTDHALLSAAAHFLANLFGTVAILYL